ncbi:hypothetical protein [Nonlabens xiamenensis]|uniref:hypothetical protein n=1 Tax=Nonlabens xiamenensis TaxID=2341043 RepID=UPI000F606604|nr:hypothetical protein [Nonlabens xiamenensis]
MSVPRSTKYPRGKISFPRIIQLFNFLKVFRPETPSMPYQDCYGEVIARENFEFGHCIFYKDFLIFEMKDVMMCGGPMFERILTVVDNYYQGKPVSMIIHREHETIMSVEALRQMSSREDTDYAFVSSHERSLDVAIYEKQNISKRFKYFNHMQDAVEWALRS